MAFYCTCTNEMVLSMLKVVKNKLFLGKHFVKCQTECLTEEVKRYFAATHKK